jgi:hypothetical protein
VLSVSQGSPGATRMVQLQHCQGPRDKGSLPAEALPQPRIDQEDTKAIFCALLPLGLYYVVCYTVDLTNPCCQPPPT